jgi:ABC-2 type transport system ATP-binding protein
MAPHAVEAHGVRVTFGRTVALDDVDLLVPRGSTLGVLGHNGAGKTSLIRVLTTALRPDRGRLLVDGIDVVATPAQVRRRIGVTGQYAGLDDFLTTVENLELVARLSGLRGAARARVSELVERFDLQAIASRRVGQLSGGSRRRVDLAASLVASPKVLFLDEPSTGLDPAARQAVWEVVAELTAAGTTVVLTTQYLEEADRLADQLIVLDGGRVAARGTPSELKRLVGGKVVKATVARDRVASLRPRPVTSAPGGDARTALAFSVADDAAAADLIAQLHADSVGVTDLEVSSPSLDDVFFHLTQSGAAA